MPEMGLFYFRTDGKGISFEVEGACRRAGTQVNCKLSFDNADTVTSMGRYGRGKFPGNADIAGIMVTMNSQKLMQNEFMFLQCHI